MCSRVYRWLAVHVRDLFSASKKASGRHVETYSRMLLGDAVRMLSKALERCYENMSKRSNFQLRCIHVQERSRVLARDWISVTGGKASIIPDTRMNDGNRKAASTIDHLPAFNPRKRGIIHGRLNASWKICSLVVNRQSFLVIDGSLLKSLLVWTV